MSWGVFSSLLRAVISQHVCIPKPHIAHVESIQLLLSIRFHSSQVRLKRAQGIYLRKRKKEREDSLSQLSSKKSKGWKGVFYYQKEWATTRWFISITLTPESMAQTRQALCKSLPWSEGSGADFAEWCLESQRGQNLSKDAWHVSICGVFRFTSTSWV